MGLGWGFAVPASRQKASGGFPPPVLSRGRSKLSFLALKVNMMGLQLFFCLEEAVRTLRSSSEVH
jgi:hypothetical protein